MLCRPFRPYDQSFDNCSGGWQSQQSCDCSSSVSSLKWTAMAAREKLKQFLSTPGISAICHHRMQTINNRNKSISRIHRYVVYIGLKNKVCEWCVVAERTERVIGTYSFWSRRLSPTGDQMFTVVGRCHETPHRLHRRQIQVLSIGKMCLVWCILLILIKKSNKLRFSCISDLHFVTLAAYSV